ncbi:MAG TPA: TonB-dependent receptor, partial [Sphingomonas sp.]|nr:TonB-dependent receptor [Sphingomonas sp.]
TSGVGRGGADANATYGSSVNLRGLGAGSTLVLLNGERPPMAGLAGVFTDLSMIPLTAIERVEILADGASALYGSDAVAGVVNIVPRDRFHGFETAARYGRADGMNEVQLSAIGGLRWDSGSAVVAWEYYHRDRLAAADRPYFSEDLRRFGLGDYRSGPGVPGTIVAGGRVFAIPGGQDGTALDPAQLIAGQSNMGDRYRRADVMPQQRRHAGFLALRQSLTDDLELWGQALFGIREFDGRTYASFNALPVTVPVANPYYADPIGTRQPVQLRYDFSRELGPETNRGRSTAFGISGGARVTLGPWQASLGLTHGVQSERTEVVNMLNTARAAIALADRDPATALNLFGDGTANNPATLARIRGSVKTGSRYTLWSTQLRADGPLFALPAGAVRLAVGAERRNERFASDPAILDYASLAPVSPVTPLIGGRRVSAAYAELLVPVTAAASPLGRIELSAAVRGEDYSDVGASVNPKFSAAWEPLDGVRLRGSWGSSFRAPSFNDLRQDGVTNAYFARALPDPASPTGFTNALLIRGNDPDLKPERATSWTLGLDYRAGAKNGLHAQLTWFDIDYRDRIASLASAIQIFFVNRAVYAPVIDDHPDPAQVAAYYASPYFQPSGGIAANAIQAVIDARTQNLASQRMRGLDFDLGYRLGVAGGTAELGASGSYIAAFRQRLTRTAPILSVVDTIGNPPDLRVRGRASWNGGPWGLAAFVNYSDGYRNNTTTPVSRVSSWTTLDLQLSYRIEGGGAFGGLALTLGATNLLDADPPLTPFVLGTRTVGYDGENASPIGRLLSIQLTKTW